MINAIDKLAKLLNLQFKDITLLQSAMTHRSASADNNERLEFLGDGALNFIIAAELYQLRPKSDEGSLSRLRANLVRGKTLSEIARHYNLGDYLNLGTGELKSGGFQRDSILADSLEAIIGAVFLDAGFESCRKFVLSIYQERLRNLPDASALVDPKTRLQEYLQARKLALPGYATVEVTGKAHEQQFRVVCDVPELDYRSEAVDSSRRKAEQAAARSLLLLIEQDSSDKKPKK